MKRLLIFTVTLFFVFLLQATVQSNQVAANGLTAASIGFPATGYTANNGWYSPIIANLTAIQGGGGFPSMVNTQSALSPTITASPVTGSISTCLGSASSSPNLQQFVVSGTNLTSDITLTAPAGFEISFLPINGYTNILLLAPVNGTVGNATIYIRSSATARAGNLADNVVVFSPGAGSLYQLVSETINAPATVNQPANQTVANGAATAAVNFTGNATVFTWVNDTPSIGLPASGTGNIPSFTAINKGSGPVSATITVMPQTPGQDCGSVPVSFTITVAPPPQITISGALPPLSTTYGTASVADNFTVSGINLSANIVVTPPAGFEVSTSNSSFTNTVTIPLTAIPAVVYIRLAATDVVGSYPGAINLTSPGVGAANYNVTIVAIAAGTVNPATLTIIADNKSKNYDEVNPVFTATYKGFVNNDDVASLTAPPVLSTTATTTSPPGQYVITVEGAASPNYAFTYISGILSVYPVIKIPNTFTPNGDGINDTWVIQYLNAYYPKSLVDVFNRYGEKVYSSIGYPIPWDGTYKGAMLPVGTYYYIINLKNGLQPLSGWVAIIK